MTKDQNRLTVVDTHAHLDHEWFAGERDAVMERAREAGVDWVLTIGSDIATSRQAMTLAETYPDVYAAVGIHPHEARSADDAGFLQLREWATHPRVVAIGEIGLDYYYDHAPHDVQQHVFRAQLQLAREVELPVIIHDRDAHGDVLMLLQEALQAGPLPRSGVLHSFTGSGEMAQEALDMGFFLSVGGMITFKNAGNLRQAIEEHVPLDRLLIETDAPYLTPEPYRGKRNEPAHVQYVAGRLAELKGVTPEEAARRTTANAAALFGVSG